MASKKLKRISVIGKEAPEIADKEKNKELSRWLVKNFKKKQ